MARLRTLARLSISKKIMTALRTKRSRVSVLRRDVTEEDGADEDGVDADGPGDDDDCGWCCCSIWKDAMIRWNRLKVRLCCRCGVRNDDEIFSFNSWMRAT